MLKILKLPLSFVEFVMAILELFDPNNPLEEFKIILDLYANLDPKKHLDQQINNLQELYAQAAQVAQLIAKLPLELHNNNDITPKMLEVACMELLKNAIEHGLLGIGFTHKSKLLADPKKFVAYANSKLVELATIVPAKDPITISFKQNLGQNASLQITIADPGLGKDLAVPQTMQDQNPRRQGFGRLIIKKVLPDFQESLII